MQRGERLAVLHRVETEHHRETFRQLLHNETNIITYFDNIYFDIILQIFIIIALTGRGFLERLSAQLHMSGRKINMYARMK